MILFLNDSCLVVFTNKFQQTIEMQHGAARRYDDDSILSDHEYKMCLACNKYLEYLEGVEKVEIKHIANTAVMSFSYDP